MHWFVARERKLSVVVQTNHPPLALKAQSHFLSISFPVVPWVVLETIAFQHCRRQAPGLNTPSQRWRSSTFAVERLNLPVVGE